MKVAFYKGTRPGIPGVYNRLIRWWTRGPYSHVEVVFRDGLSASSSFMDGGVRFKKIDFDPAKWDMVEVGRIETKARRWFLLHEGQGYDLYGVIRFMFSPFSDSPTRWFCSEAVAAALGLSEPWRYDPNTLAIILKGNKNG